MYFEFTHEEIMEVISEQKEIIQRRRAELTALYKLVNENNIWDEEIMEKLFAAEEALISSTEHVKMLESTYRSM